MIDELEGMRHSDQPIRQRDLHALYRAMEQHREDDMAGHVGNAWVMIVCTIVIVAVVIFDDTLSALVREHLK